MPPSGQPAGTDSRTRRTVGYWCRFSWNRPQHPILWAGTLTVVSANAIAESRYRCTVTDQFGLSKHSAKRELTVLDFQKYAISVSAIPQEITLGASETTKVQVVIDGSKFPDHIYSYCWFKTDKLTIEEGDWGSEPFGFPLKITAENPYEGSVRVCVLNEEDSTCLAYTDILVHKK